MSGEPCAHLARGLRGVNVTSGSTDIKGVVLPSTCVNFNNIK